MNKKYFIILEYIPFIMNGKSVMNDLYILLNGMFDYTALIYVLNLQRQYMIVHKR